MSYRYYLPYEQNQPQELFCESNALIFIGANGSGKSKLGAWLEQTDISNTHRIGAQRSLKFGKFIQQKGLEQATNLLIYGSTIQRSDHSERWNWDGEKRNYTASLLDDYEHVLSALLAKKILQQETYIATCRELDASGKIHERVPEMVDDVLKRIWDSVFPHRSIKLDDGKVVAFFNEADSVTEYQGRDMSDGERVALYLIAQALCVPEGRTIIIDEPELHLHRSIMNRLWSSIENERPDCLFVYITHDTMFASNHRLAKKIWVKAFDGNKWEWEEICNNELPEQLLLNIMGNRRQVIFVEGEPDSIDTKLYSLLYKDYYIVPCGGCSKVIERTKSMKASPQLHDMQCYGIIDRDYRSEYELKKLREVGVYNLKVAEVENLFVVAGLLQFVNKLLSFPDQKNVDLAIRYIIEDRYQGEINRQICSAVVSEIKHILATTDISKKSDEEAKQALKLSFESISYDNIKKPIEESYTEALKNKDYDKVLELYNRKSLVDSVGKFFSLKNDEYCNFVIRQLNTLHAENIRKILEPYLPSDIPLIPG